MKILKISGKIGQGDILQQPVRDRIDFWDRIVGKNSVCGWIKYLDWLSRGRSCNVCGLGEVSLAFEEGRYGGKLVEGLLPAPTVVIHKVKSLVPSFIYMWNVQWPSDRATKI